MNTQSRVCGDTALAAPAVIHLQIFTLNPVMQHGICSACQCPDTGTQRRMDLLTLQGLRMYTCTMLHPPDAKLRGRLVHTSWHLSDVLTDLKALISGELPEIPDGTVVRKRGRVRRQLWEMEPSTNA